MSSIPPPAGTGTDRFGTRELSAFLEAIRQPWPRIVTLCGSTRFSEAFAAALRAETLAGRIVQSIGCDLRTDRDLFDLQPAELSELKDGLDELHLRKIDLSDEILVLNVGGYIGSSTRGEIDYARGLSKRVRYLEPVCDNTSVAVIIRNATGELLVFERATFPPGVACVAGHLDDHRHVRDAAVAETSEELGLTVVSLTEMLDSGGWRNNRCRRHPGERGAGGIGHQWWVFEAVVEGDLAPSDRETRNARWATPAELQQLANRTAFYADGHLTDTEFQTGPGLEPVQVQWLVDAGVIQMPAQALTAIDALAARGTVAGR